MEGACGLGSGCSLGGLWALPSLTRSRGCPSTVWLLETTRVPFTSPPSSTSSIPVSASLISKTTPWGSATMAWSTTWRRLRRWSMTSPSAASIRTQWLAAERSRWPLVLPAADPQDSQWGRACPHTNQDCSVAAHCCFLCGVSFRMEALPGGERIAFTRTAVSLLF